MRPPYTICNQSVGLIQREVERRGIATIGISIARKFTETVKPPRSIFLAWPFGHPLGEPHNVLQQRAVITKAFLALYAIKRPGEIVDVPYRWKREVYNNHSVKELLECRNQQVLVSGRAVGNVATLLINT